MRGDGDARSVEKPNASRRKKTTETTDALDLATPVVERFTQRTLTGSAHLLQDLVATVLKAAARATSLNDACLDNPRGPSRRALSRAATRIDLTLAEQAVNEELWNQVRKKLPPRFKVYVDLTYIPYHGKPHQDDAELVRTQPKQGTTWSHAYATVCVAGRGRRFTLAVFYVRRGEKVADVMDRVLHHVCTLGLRERVEFVVADKAFYTVRVLAALRERGFFFVLPVPFKGRRIQALCRNGPEGWTTHTVRSERGATEHVRLAVVRARNPPRKRGKPSWEFVSYAVRGVHGSPQHVDALYRKRGGIETTYKLANQARARTSSRRPGVRLFFFAVAMILQNAWTMLHTLAVHAMVRVGCAFRAFLRRIVTATPRGPAPGGGSP